MKCAHFKEQVGAWALGALEPRESAEMAAHLAEAITHEGCRQALTEAQRTVAHLALALAPVRPRSRVWSTIAARIGTPQRTWRAREIAGFGLAAAAAIALLSVNHDRVEQTHRADTQTARADKSDQLLATAQSAMAERDACRKALETLEVGATWQRDALALLEKPTTKVVALTPVGGQSYRASAIVNLEEKRSVVVASAMAREPGKDFEMWVIRGKAAPVSAGLMRSLPGGIAVGEIDPRVLAAGPPDAIAVSREKAGGSTTGTPATVLMAGAVHG